MPRKRSDASTRARSPRSSTRNDSLTREAVPSVSNRTTPEFNDEARTMTPVLRTPLISSSRPYNAERSLSVAEVIRLLPEYDGINMELENFADECRSYFELINPADRVIMIRVIISKIKGAARSMIGDKKYTNVEEIIADLTRVSDGKRDYFSVSLELGTLSQGEAESTISWGLRVKGYINKLTTGAKISMGENNTMAGIINKQATECFIRGLKPEINRKMITEKISSFDEAIDKAQFIERCVSQNKTVFKNLDEKPALRELYKIEENSGNNRPRNNNIRCYNCSELGHIARRCDKPRNPPVKREDINSDAKIDKNESAASDAGPAKQCEFCQKTNHVIADCKIFKLRCSKCSVRGHTERFCQRDAIRADYLNRAAKKMQEPKNE